MKPSRSLFVCAFVCCLCILSASAFAQNNATQPKVLTQTQYNRPAYFDASPALSELGRQPVQINVVEEASAALKPKLAKQQQFNLLRPITSQVNQNGNVQFHAPVPATVGVNVLGVGKNFFGYTVPDAPTDVNLSVGDTQVVEWVNVHFAVFDKVTGNNILVGGNHFTAGNALWTATPCSNHNSGDIIAQWDKMAHRWVMFQPVFNQVGGFYYGCFAISTSADFLGTWYRYAFPMTANFPDYPKLGIQREAYYQSNNMFNAAGTAYLGAMPCAYNRPKMLAGDPTAEQVCILDNSNGTYFDDSFVPADLDSPELPLPTGTPEVFLGSIDNYSSETHVYLYTMSVNFTNGTGVLTGIDGSTPITVTNPTVGPALPAYTGLCNFGSTACVPQKSTTSKLDSLGDRLMYRLALRRTVNAANVPVNHWLISHSIVNGSTGAERWYEFRSANNNLTNLTLYQGGTYAPDATYRFMGSLAMDKAGNIALGYTRSSSTLFPDMYYTGRLPGDAAGTMQGEVAIVDQTVATGSQRSTGNRWGDYTDMALDNDGCTFWYANQYYVTPNSTFGWSTRVASLKFTSCTPWNPVP